MPTEHIKIIDKLYDPETGDGALELTKRDNGTFDLVIYHNNDDMTLYGLTQAELLRIGNDLQAIASPTAVGDADSSCPECATDMCRHATGIV